MARKYQYRVSAGGVMTSDVNPREARVERMSRSGGICTDTKSGDVVFFTWEEHKSADQFPELIEHLKNGGLRVGDTIVYMRRVRALRQEEVERELQLKVGRGSLAGRIKVYFWPTSQGLRLRTGGCATDLVIAAAYWYLPKGL